MLLVVFPRKTLLEGTAVNISFCPSHTCSHPVRPPSPGRLHCQPPPERLDLKRRTRAWESTWSQATLRHQVEGVSQAEDRPVPSVSRGPGLPASLPRGSSPGRAPFSAVFSGHKCCIVRIFLPTGSSGGPRRGGLMGRRKVLPGPLPVTEPGLGGPARRPEPSLPPRTFYFWKIMSGAKRMDARPVPFSSGWACPPA